MRPSSLLVLSAFVIQVQAQELPSVLQATTPEVDRLIQVLQPKIALERARSIVPAVKPPCVGGDFASFQKSTQDYRALAGMYLLQGRAAMAAGAWEEAQQSYAKGLAVAQENQANYDQNAQFTVDGLLKVSGDAEAFKKEKAAQIKDMMDSVKNIKSNPLEILKLQQAIKEQEALITRGRQSVAFVTGVKKDLAADLQALTAAQQNLNQAMEAEKAAITAYNTAKNKKGNAPWVAAALLDKNYAAKYPTAREQSDLLHRLMVLDPANTKLAPKVEGLRQGKLAFVPAKVVKTTKKKK